MAKFLRVLFFCGLFIQVAEAQPVLIDIGTSTVETNTVFTTTDLPWELKYGPNDSLWMTTKEGRVYRINKNNGNAVTLLDHSASVWQSGESGMLGMTFHPNFPGTPYVYIAYTYTSGGNNRERLSRFTYSGNSLTPASEFVLVEGILANTTHNGSRLVILPDNTILMTTGDAANTANAQNITNNVNGKVLRMNLDGSIPADNPIAGSRLYSWGHRNPQGLALHPNGKVYSTEHGPNNNDEFQIIEKGRNYGWPNVEGFCDNDKAGETTFCTANNVKEPLASWNPIPGGTWAPNDLVWYTSTAIPEFQNSFLVTFLKTNKLRRITLNAAGDAITGQTDFFVNQWGRLRDIAVAPDGVIYIATNTSPNRIISMRNTVVLPVAISNYSVNCNANTPLVTWTTNSELNNKQFLVYRSTDGTDFALAGTVQSLASAGNSGSDINYRFTDSLFRGTKAYYKLVSVDNDDRQKEWGVISSLCRNGAITFTLMPNPSHVGVQTILQIENAIDPVYITIHNADGKAVFQARENGTVKFPSERWPRGTYNVIVRNQNKEVIYTNRLMLQ